MLGLEPWKWNRDDFFLPDRTVDLVPVPPTEVPQTEVPQTEGHQTEGPQNVAVPVVALPKKRVIIPPFMFVAKFLKDSLHLIKYFLPLNKFYIYDRTSGI
jgi:hypothetical protein